MQAETKRRMDALLSGGGRLVLETYLEELIEDKRREYDSCNRETFDTKKGEVLGLLSFLNYVRGKR